jgi:hypothetical protein
LTTSYRLFFLKMSWQDIQQNTFTAWCNEFLKDRGMRINDLQKDLNKQATILEGNGIDGTLHIQPLFV